MNGSGAKQRPSHLARVVRLAATIAMVVVTAGNSDCGGSGSTEPKLPVGFAVTFDGPVTIPQKGSVSVPVTLTRLGGFTGGVELTGKLALIGMQVSSATIPAGGTTATVVVTSDGSVSPSTFPNTLEITGSAAGYQPVTAVRTTVIVAIGSFRIQRENGLDNGITGRVEANPGYTMRRAYGISRNQYAGAITFTASAITGVTTSFSPQPTSADSVIMSLTVAASVPPELYNIKITGVGTDGVKDSLTDNFLVRAPTYEFVAKAPLAEIERSGSGQAAVLLLRDPGFTQAISVSFTERNGLTSAPISIPASTSAAALTISASSTALLGQNTYTVRATSPGQQDQTSDIKVAVKGFDLVARTSIVTITAGTSGTDTVDVLRYAFPATIALSANATPGITLRADSLSVAGNRVVLSIDVAGSTSPGKYPVTLTGTSGSTLQNATFEINVIAPPPTNSPTLAVNPRTVSLSQGRSTTVSSIVTNGLNVTDVTWSTRDASIATIAANGSRSVTVTGVKAGSSTYIVGSYAYFGGESRDSALVTVTAASTAQVDHITLEPDSANVANGQQVQYRVRYWNASNVEMNGEVGNTTAFTVDVSSVAQIGGSNGMLTARGIGSSFVNASYRMPYYDSLTPVKASLTAKAKIVVR